MPTRKNTDRTGNFDRFDKDMMINLLPFKISEHKAYLSELEDELISRHNISSSKKNVFRRKNFCEIFANSLSKSISSFSFNQKAFERIKSSSLDDDSLATKLDWENVSHYLMLSFEKQINDFEVESANGK